MRTNRTWILALAAVTVLAACGRQGPADNGKSVEVDGRKTNLGQLRKESERAEKAAVKGTGTLAPTGVKDLLPASVNGYARGPVATKPGLEPGMTTSSARYLKGGVGFMLEVTDDGTAGAIGVNPANVGATSTRKTPTGYETISTAGGRTTTEQWDTATRSGRYAVVAANRYSISADGAADDVSVLKAAVEAVNAARLRALAPTG